MLDTIKNFFAITDNKYIFAIVLMIFIVSVIIYLLVQFSTFYKARKSTLNIKLPDVNYSEKDEKILTPFEEKEITTELIHTSEEENMISKSKKNVNDNSFISALSIETRSVILSEPIKISMPEVEQLNHDKMNEEKIKEQEKLNYIREIAKADKTHSELDNFDNLLSETNNMKNKESER